MTLVTDCFYLFFSGRSFLLQNIALFCSRLPYFTNYTRLTDLCVIGKMLDMGKPGFKKLLLKPSFTGKDAKAHGIDPHALSYYVNKGVLERVARGVYRNPNVENDAPFEWQDLLETAQSIPEGTICGISALSYYELTQEIQRKFWIAVPFHAGIARRPKTKILRTRNLSLGRVPLKVDQYQTFIFDRERCVVDAFRYLSKESALRTLKEYLRPTKDRKPDLPKLGRYARALRVNISPYLEALT
jgi:Transcriptional regulator, AbiEi antitoxin